VLCTGYSKQINEAKAKEMGIKAFVLKPMVMSELAKTIRKVLDQNDMNYFIVFNIEVVSKPHLRPNSCFANLFKMLTYYTVYAALFHRLASCS